MRVLVQRVSHSSVSVSGQVIGEIGQGLLLLVGFGKDDVESVIPRMAEKIANLRIFSDEAGRFNHSLLDVNGGALVVPQFTLYGDTTRGRRPDFFSAMEPTKASDFVDKFEHELKRIGISQVAKGEFGANMQVSLINDGPVTIWLEL